MACPRVRTWSWVSGSASPAAIRSCSSTRSSPVTSSVTGCSTCSRVFISRKKKVSPSAGTISSMVPTPAVAAGAGGADRRVQHRVPHRVPHRRTPLCAVPVCTTGGEERCGRLLHHLLVPALQAALAFAEVQHGSVRVSQHLHLDVPWSLQVALDQQRAVPERGDRLAAGRRHLTFEIGGVGDDPQPLPATARGRLDQQREADLQRGVGGSTVGQRHPRQHGHPGRRDEPSRRHLVAHRGDGGRRRPDEDQPGVRAGRREPGVLGQEAVARVHRLRSAAACGVHDPLDGEVALRCARRPDPDGGVGQPDVQRPRVRVGVHRDGPQAEPAQGPDDPDRDLAAVGHEHAVEREGRARHLHHIRKMP